MLIGIIADTHDNVEMTIKAMDFLKNRKVRLLIHAGDLTSPHMLDFFSQFECHFALGNCDEKCSELNCRCSELGLDKIEKQCEFTYDGKLFLVFHGNDVPAYREAIKSQKYDYIIKGHTHFFEDYIRNGAHIINPGSLSHGEENTIAVLDTETDKVERVDLFSSF